MWSASWFLVCILFPDIAFAGTPYIGMQPQEMTPQAMSALGLKVPSGVIIRNVGADTPAFDDGIRQGDIILKINTKNIETLKQLGEIVSGSESGDILKISL